MLNLKYIFNRILFNKGKKREKPSEGLPHMVEECGVFVKVNLEMLCISGSKDFLWKRTFKDGITCCPESLCDVVKEARNSIQI